MSAVLVRDLALEQWPSMDRYAAALAARLPGVTVPDEWRTMGGPRYLTRYWRYPRRLRRYRGDLVHVLDHSYAHCLGAFPGVPSVVTVHDLQPLRTLAEDGGRLRSLVRDPLLRWSLGWVKRADRVIVSTGFTAHEVEQFLGVPAERIRRIAYGVDEAFFARAPDSAIAATRARWRAALGRGGDAERVVLHVGSCIPRKNVEAAIGALGLLRARGLDAVLVQVGGAFGPAHRRAIAEAGVEAHVLQEPALADDELLVAYYAADALVIPSSFEGFGMPALEAMAAGLPVVTSGAGGLREAIGDAGIAVMATSAMAIAEGLHRVLTDPASAAELRARGLVRARSFQWDDIAKQTRAVHDELRAGA
jgi:alpha-1,3-rhamnosyl/mannosyltransferase